MLFNKAFGAVFAFLKLYFGDIAPFLDGYDVIFASP